MAEKAWAESGHVWLRKGADSQSAVILCESEDEVDKVLENHSFMSQLRVESLKTGRVGCFVEFEPGGKWSFREMARDD